MKQKSQEMEPPRPSMNASLKDEHPQQEVSVTQLSLLDLFIWITFAAAVCAANQAVRRHFGEFGLIPPVRFTAELIAFPAGLTALMLAVKGQLRHRRQVLSPGMWLLCLEAVSAFFFISTSLIIVTLGNLARGGDLPEPTPFLVGIYILRDLITLLGIAAIAVLLPVRAPWRMIALVPFLYYLPMPFFTLGVAIPSDALIGISMRIMGSRHYILGGGILLLIGLAIWDNATTRNRRDWLHWLGIAIVLQYYVYLLASHLQWV
ncbi:hypothetical protein [Blastopirellula marina]|uniref:Uncharacterized protein n=1 Tax=Blastopirellula marina TaxID=124 RepID=A0A2S8GQL3_9BACT|nr:hypothetical protein [Blastopirellula marina]PQO46314.1 hypothetical protein C5Y93_10035 [Blastopirellula marina]